jgi:hypothetical protein
MGKRRVIHAVAFAIVLALSAAHVGVVAAAKNKTNTPKKAVIEEKAANILDKTCKALAALTGYAFHADVTLDKVYQDGSKIQYERAMEVTVRRPGAFKVVTDGDDFQATSVFDGKTFTIALPGRKVYGQINAAMDTDALIDLLSAKYGIESPLGDLLSNTPCDKLLAVAGYYVGKAIVDGAACDHLFFQGKDVDWQIWVEDGPSGLPRKIIITEKKMPMAPQFTAVLSAWKTADSGAEIFEFKVPENFTREDDVITGAKPVKPVK